MSKRVSLLVCLSIISAIMCFTSHQVKAANGFRPPAVPLVVHDPYFSVWSPADRLTDAETQHWTGSTYPLHAMVRINDKTWRLMGSEPSNVEAMPQKSLKVTATQTIYKFECPEAFVELKFAAPMIPEDLDLLTQPATYIRLRVTPKENLSVQVAWYLDASGALSVNIPNQKVQWSQMKTGNIQSWKMGNVDQPILAKCGDAIRIDWGYLILSAPDSTLAPLFLRTSVDTSIQPGKGKELRALFAEGKAIDSASTLSMPCSIQEGDPVLAYVCQTRGTVSKQTELLAVLAYDDIESVRYFDSNLPAWWRRDGKTTEQLVEGVWSYITHPKGRNLQSCCDAFDQQIEEQMTKVGGPEYAQLCHLAWRQMIGAQKVVADSNKMPLMFSKENYSNGCIGTVDVMYPCMPALLYYSPILAKATVEPILAYSATKRWPHPFAPHDLGTYPQATGQVYGGGERTEKNQMPVEECGNMLLQLAAISFIDGNADYASRYWEVLTKWAHYLEQKGFDPENQLCTDDFAGHLAHNVNLSVKAILGLAAYGQMAKMRGENETAEKYVKLARSLADRWMKEANDGDHYRLTFDQPGTWSMKYNLLWDKVLNMSVFPPEVVKREMAFYKTKINKYGLPLDSRSQYSKIDWILWTCALTENRADFDTLFKPAFAYVNETPDRVPICDWYWTNTSKKINMLARSVVGGFWAPMLINTQQWKAVAAQGQNIQGTWARPVIRIPFATPIPNAKIEAGLWKYTLKQPSQNWYQTDFNDSFWQEGKAGFGTRNAPGAVINTEWKTSDIWLRRTFEITELPEQTMAEFVLHHEEDAEIYVNGQLVQKFNGYAAGYFSMISPQLVKALKTGKNTIAVHCHQTKGEQYIDVGFRLYKNEK